jgi:hypothetical protein
MPSLARHEWQSSLSADVIMFPVSVRNFSSFFLALILRLADEGGKGSMMGMIMATEMETVVRTAVARAKRGSLVQTLTSANRSIRARRVDERCLDGCWKYYYASTPNDRRPRRARDSMTVCLDIASPTRDRRVLHQAHRIQQKITEIASRSSNRW